MVMSFINKSDIINGSLFENFVEDFFRRLRHLVQFSIY